MRYALCLCLLLLISALPKDVQAALTYDLRLLPGQGVAGYPDATKQLIGANLGDVIHLELFAVVTGTNDLLPERFEGGYLTILTTNGGSLRGDLAGALLPEFSEVGPGHGKSIDLDGDGDRDLGSLDPSGGGGYIWPWSYSPHPPGIQIPNGLEFKLGDIRLTITSIDPQSLQPITIRPRVPDFTSLISEATWVEDGVLHQPFSVGGGQQVGGPLPSAGDPVTVFPIPEPSSAALILLGSAFLVRRKRRFSRAIKE
jgi:hypothetical protein